jgi:hypothetical protein
MDLKKLRPTKSLFATPRMAIADAHQRCRMPSVPAAVEAAQPLRGRGSDLWWGYYHDALLRGHPDPEKMADTALRSREKTIALTAARPATKQTLEIPKPLEAVAAAKPKGRQVLHDAFRCKALTLEGRRCGFKATCGDFCKKHSVEKI